MSNKGLELAKEHLRKYPEINWAQQKQFAEEMRPLIKLRPQLKREDANGDSR